MVRTVSMTDAVGRQAPRRAHARPTVAELRGRARADVVRLALAALALALSAPVAWIAGAVA